MKNIGLIGGMSWESSAEYYRLINQETKRRLGGQHNARSLLLTVDFAEVEQLQHVGEWDRLGVMLADASRQLEQGGAELLVLCHCCPKQDRAVARPSENAGLPAR